MVEGTFQKTFMNNPNLQMHTLNFYLMEPTFTYIYKLMQN